VTGTSDDNNSSSATVQLYGIIKVDIISLKIAHGMQHTSNNTRKWNVFALSIMALAIAVFAWGLNYKLSLYESAAPPPSHVTVAKLLSNRERPADTALTVERAITPTLLLFAVAFTAFASLLLDQKRQSRWVLQRARNSRPRVLPLFSHQILFRPPPPRR
jgi:hypothetical protein